MEKKANKSKQKHVPMRSCIATRVKKPKHELIRIVYNIENHKVEIDEKGKVRARGASLDMTENAFDLMVKKKVLKSALKIEKEPSKEEFEVLKKDFLDAIEYRKFRQGSKPVTIRIKKEALSYTDLIQE